MTIKFICSCGKHLRARDEMAARRSFCPRCGEPVGIPSLDPNHPAPMTPVERQRLARQRERSAAARPADHEAVTEHLDVLPLPAVQIVVTEVAPPRPLEPETVVPRRPRKKLWRRGWELERNWGECVLYPFRAWPLVFGLSFALFLTTLITAAIFPELLVLPTPDFLVGSLWAVGVPLLFLAYAVAFLQCVLSSGMDGECRYVRWPGRDAKLVARAAAVWLVCFLAGPAFLAAAGVWYWISCGEMGRLDYVILAELWFLGVGYWALGLASVTENDRLGDVHPRRVVGLAERLGRRAVIAAALAAALALGFASLLALALEELHRDFFGGAILVGVSWFGGLFGATFLLRLLGLWCHRARVTQGRARE